MGGPGPSQFTHWNKGIWHVYSPISPLLTSFWLGLHLPYPLHSPGECWSFLDPSGPTSFPWDRQGWCMVNPPISPCNWCETGVSFSPSATHFLTNVPTTSIDVCSTFVRLGDAAEESSQTQTWTHGSTKHKSSQCQIWLLAVQATLCSPPGCMGNSTNQV